MHRCKKRTVTIFTALIMTCVAQSAFAAGQLPPLRSYRDLKVYTTSAPDSRRPNRIVARTQFVNEGSKSLSISANLAACSALSFRGTRFSAVVKPGKTGLWTWEFRAPAKLKKRQILTGSIDISNRRERDLYVSVFGTDTPQVPAKDVEKITEMARVVATYAPRTQASIDAEMLYRKEHQPKPELTLAAKGESAYSIVVESEPATRDQVIGDLLRVIKLQSGAELPIGTSGGGRAIILRRANPGQKAKGLYDAYRLRTVGRDVVIESETPEGLRNGVYGLLTDHLGANWFMPDQLGEEITIPSDRTVRLPKLDEVRGSVWSSCTGVSWGRSGPWDIRNRTIVSRGRMCFGHSWETYIMPRLYPYDKYPEYYARDRKGKILNQWGPPNFCSTNPDVIDIVAKGVNDYFRNDSEAIVKSLDPNDYQPMCLCDRCLALDKQYGVTKDDGSQAADRLLHFSKEIYDRLEPQFKDRYLGILVYGFQIELPKSARPHAHHAGIICDMCWAYDTTRPWNDPTSKLNRHFYDLVKGWGKLLPQFGYYDYYGVGGYYGPWPYVHKLREDLPAFHDMGGTFVVLEAQPNFATQGLNHYAATQLVRDIGADIDIALEKFFREYYGPAAKPMRDYWLVAERYYATERPNTSSAACTPMRPEFWQDLAGCLARAGRIAARLPAHQKRFADRVKMATVGFNYSRCRFDYDRQFDWAASEYRQTIDHKAAVEYLRKHRSEIEEPQKKYSGGDGYWQMLVPIYYVMDIDAEIKKHENPAPIGIEQQHAVDMPGYSDEETFGEMRKTMTEVFDFPKDGWRFYTDEKNMGLGKRWFAANLDDSRWGRVSIGKFWEEEGFIYNGMGWYRLKFKAPMIEPGKQVFIVVGAADDYAKVWLNGKLIGEQNLPIGTGWNKAFGLDATKVLKPGQNNVLAVRVEDAGALGGLWKSIKIMVK
jgi:hypothetical protein